MVHRISTNRFTHQNQVSFYGKIHYSSYNHNYYTSERGVIILEECDDDNGFYYYWIDLETGDANYLGGVTATFGIFDKEYDGYPSRDENGIVELDSDWC